MQASHFKNRSLLKNVFLFLFIYKWQKLRLPRQNKSLAGGWNSLAGRPASLSHASDWSPSAKRSHAPPPPMSSDSVRLSCSGTQSAVSQAQSRVPIRCLVPVGAPRGRRWVPSRQLRNTDAHRRLSKLRNTRRRWRHTMWTGSRTLLVRCVQGPREKRNPTSPELHFLFFRMFLIVFINKKSQKN